MEGYQVQITAYMYTILNLHVLDEESFLISQNIPTTPIGQLQV